MDGQRVNDVTLFGEKGSRDCFSRRVLWQEPLVERIEIW